MSQFPTPGGGPNQTLLELILALKGLAQTFDLAHDSLKSVIEAESKVTGKELDRIRDLIAKNNQSIAVLPITISDRVERLIDNLEKDIDERVEGMLREITVSINQVQEKFVNYIQAKGEAVPEELKEGGRTTGRIEIKEGGEINLRFQAGWVKKAVVASRWALVGSASYGVIELLRYFLGV